MKAEAVLRELDGLRALARSLVHGDAEAEDLLQDAAVATLEHPPDDERPVRPWLALVLRNRRRMDARAAARRKAREQVVAETLASATSAEAPDAAIDRARALERLSTALVALEEPFRTTVIRRYLDGKTAAEIARELRVPAGTIRWRLKTGLERLRAALDRTDHGWQRAFAPLAPLGGLAVVKTKTSFIALAILILLLGLAALVLVLRRDDAPRPEPPAVASRAGSASLAATTAGGAPATPQPVRDPLPGQGRAVIEAAPGGGVSGRVINWSTGDGVEGADLTFTNEAGATTVRSGEGGVFALAPPEPGAFTLSAISKPGFLPYAPELQHSSVHVQVNQDRAVRGITVFLFPAVDYQGRVVDDHDQPVAGAQVRMLGTPAGEQAIEKLATEWTTDKDGRFGFHAADDAVFEAVRGRARGWARLGGDVQITRQMLIKISDRNHAQDGTIRGRVVDAGGNPLADALVRANPNDVVPRHEGTPAIATAFATTGADGTFVLEHLAKAPSAYDVTAQLEGYAMTLHDGVVEGTRGLDLVLDRGAVLAGTVVDREGNAVPAFTLLVLRRLGAVRALVEARSLVDATGRFEVRVPAGDYDVIAAASGWAPSEPVTAAAGARDLRVVVSVGATLRGQVVATDGTGGVSYARIMLEARGGGASARPANAGTVTRQDGTFELTGLPPGPVSITIGAGGYHPKIEAGLTASDGATLGPLTIALTPLAEGEQPALELVGIGVQLIAEGDVLRVERVFPASGAADAGIVAGDRITAVDGAPVTQLGVEGAVAKIRGTPNTTISITLKRADKLVPLVVTRKKLRA